MMSMMTRIHEGQQEVVTVPPHAHLHEVVGRPEAGAALTTHVSREHPVQYLPEKHVNYFESPRNKRGDQTARILVHEVVKPGVVKPVRRNKELEELTLVSSCRTVWGFLSMTALVHRARSASSFLMRADKARPLW